MDKSTAKATTPEVCYGCGAKAQEEKKIVGDQIVTTAQHPIVGILHASEVEKAGGAKAHGAKAAAEPGEDGETYVQVPVCKACHVDPAHRTAHPLKCHFFERAQAKMGLAMAGSFNIAH